MTRSNWAARGLAFIALIGVGSVAVQKIKAMSPQNRTTAGVDNDHNGIRDEVDALIAREFQTSPAQTVYAQRLARVLQIAATTASPTHEQVISLMKEQLLQIGCLQYNTPEATEGSVTSRLLSATLNSLGRIKNCENISSLTGMVTYVGIRPIDCKL